jgi:predicted MFS family arabinose efflux permease
VLRLDLLRRREFALIMGTSFVYRFHVSAVPFLLPLLMQTVLGMPVSAVSAALLALGLGSLGGRPLISLFARRWSLRSVLASVGSLGALILAVPALFGPGFPYWGIFAVMLLGGILRTGFLFYGMVLAFDDAPREEVAHVSTLNTVSQQFSMSIGVAVSGALLSWTSSGGALQSADFAFPFLLFALCALLASLALLLLPRSTGEGL